nr:site-specific recombinase [Bacteriovorax sp. HI3]
MLFNRLISIFRKYKQYEVDENKKTSLDLILSEANPQSSLETRIEWLQKLVKWIRGTDLFEDAPEKAAATKIKYLFMVLERNPDKKEKIQKSLTLTLQELSSIEFFCEVGLPSQIGLIGELVDKLTEKILPKKPIGHQLSELMITLFPDEEDVQWLKSLDEQTLEKLTTLFDTNNETYPHLKSDIEEALIYLISQIVAIGLSPGIRKRIPHKRMKSLPFFYLSGKLNLYLKTKSENNNPALAQQLHEELLDLLMESQAAISEVYHHLDRFGVSTHLVFQLERMKLFLKRTHTLLDIVSTGHLTRTRISHFVAELVEQNLLQRNAMGIYSNNATLLAQKIIENNSQAGEHYIAKDKKEYVKMVKSAMGGGVLTALTVLLKNLLGMIGLNKFFYGAFSTINYAGSFLFIQMCGFTLATKQPAATAPALAKKLELAENREGIEAVTDEIVYITRTQIAAVFGNLAAVIPAILIINYICMSVTGHWLFSPDTAYYTLHSTDILGPTIIYGAFTGVLLWSSSVIAGWTTNWYSFHQLSYLITNNKKIKTILTADGAKKVAHFFDHEITGIAGSVSLGFLLGLMPEILKFIGIPLEVRHVTLSTGALTAAVSSLGVESLKSPEFIRAALGIVLIGFLNLSVSFLLALFVAFRAKKISSHRKALIFQSVLKRFYQKPFSFFIPKSST